MRTAYARSVLTSLSPLILALALLAPPSLGAGESLALNINKAIAAPGGLAAVVIRTYASRSIGQGQICFRAATTGGAAPEVSPGALTTSREVSAGPFAAIEGFEVFSDLGDAVASASFDITAAEQTAVLQFSSSSASINRSDGPLAVVFFRLIDSLQPDQEFQVEIDLGRTILFDPDGLEVPVRPRSGRLTIRAPADPYLVKAEGSKVTAGEVAELGVKTFEPVAMSRGQVGVRYDTTIAAGPPIVRLDRRYGSSIYLVDRSTPGLLLIAFAAPDRSLNSVPGSFITLDLPTRSDIPSGSASEVFLDPALTFFEDAAGMPLPVALESKPLQFR